MTSIEKRLEVLYTSVYKYLLSQISFSLFSHSHHWLTLHILPFCTKLKYYRNKTWFKFQTLTPSYEESKVCNIYSPDIFASTFMLGVQRNRKFTLRFDSVLLCHGSIFFRYKKRFHALLNL